MLLYHILRRLEISYILAKLFNLSLKEPCFSVCWTVIRCLQAISLHKNATEKLEAKTIILEINIISVFKKLINANLVTKLERSGFFTDFQNIFSVFRPTNELFRLVVDKIAWTFNVSGATRAVDFDISAQAYLEPCLTSMMELFYENC